MGARRRAVENAMVAAGTMQRPTTFQAQCPANPEHYAFTKTVLCCPTCDHDGRETLQDAIRLHQDALEALRGDPESYATQENEKAARARMEQAWLERLVA